MFPWRRQGASPVSNEAAKPQKLGPSGPLPSPREHPTSGETSNSVEKVKCNSPARGLVALDIFTDPRNSRRFPRECARLHRIISEGLSVMAKPTTVKIKLASTADTGFFYVTKKNPRTQTEKLSFKKYDPVVRKHVEFKETKIK